MGLENVDRYEIIREHLTHSQLGKLISMIQDSERFELGDLNHIVLSGTETPVGYMGDETAELCFPKGRVPKNYRISHSHLRRIFASA